MMHRGRFASFRAALNGPLLWLGVLVGAMSGISAVARILDVGLLGVFSDFVSFYRGLLSPLYTIVSLLPHPFFISPLGVDLAATYAVLFGMSIRSEFTGAGGYHEAKLHDAIGRANFAISPDRLDSLLQERRRLMLSDHQNPSELALVEARIRSFKRSERELSWEFASRVALLLLKCIVLLPVLTALPIRRYRRRLPGRAARSYLKRQFDLGERYLPPTNATYVQDALAFAAVPSAIVLYFLLNAYVPQLPS